MKHILFQTLYITPMIRETMKSELGQKANGGKTVSWRQANQWQTIECGEDGIWSKYAFVRTKSYQRLIVEEVLINVKNYCCWKSAWIRLYCNHFHIKVERLETIHTIADKNNWSIIITISATVLTENWTENHFLLPYLVLLSLFFIKDSLYQRLWMLVCLMKSMNVLTR